MADEDNNNVGFPRPLDENGREASAENESPQVENPVENKDRETESPLFVQQDEDRETESPLFVQQDEDRETESPLFVQQDDDRETESPLFVRQDEDERPMEFFDSTSPDSDNDASPMPARQSGEDASAEIDSGGTHSPANDDPLQCQEKGDEEGASQYDQAGGHGRNGHGHDDSGGDSDSSSSGFDCNSSEGSSPTHRKLEERLAIARGKIRIANKRIAAQGQTITALKERIKRLQAENQQLKSRVPAPEGDDLGVGQARGSWRDLLRQSISDDNKLDYEEAWKRSNGALNMSVDPDMVHPQIRFVPWDSSSRRSSPNYPALTQAGFRDRSAMQPDPHELPDNVLYQILYELLTTTDLIHCISRLDPFLPPDSFPTEHELGQSATGIRGRFFISGKPRSLISLTHDTQDPQTVLAALSVCRKWAWYGIHIFYGVNTFAFSSFSELDRFCCGCKQARVQRLQHVELTWVGGKCVTAEGEVSGQRLNRRTLPLSWFCETASLKTLCLHISETSKYDVRRKHEPVSQKLYMKGKTSGQPNTRLTRSMRNCMGMDYIYSLRGLHWVHVYDLHLENINPDRKLAAIRDQSFVIDVERVVTQAKVPKRLEKSRLENLDELFPVRDTEWSGPSPDDFARIRPIYTEITGYENRFNDLDQDTTSGGESSRSSSPFSDSDGSDVDGAPGTALPKPPGSWRRRHESAPGPLQGPVESDTEQSEEETEHIEAEQSGEDDEIQRSESGGSEDTNGSSSDSEGGDPFSAEVYEQQPINKYLHRGDSQAPGMNFNDIGSSPKVQSAGGLISGSERHVIKIEDDDDVQEIPAPFPRPTPARLASRLSLFVTPGPDEPGRSTGTPDTRRRSTSGLFVRQPFPGPFIDLTAIDEEDRGENDIGVTQGTQGGDPAEEASAIHDAGAGTGNQLAHRRTKRSRDTSPRSEGSWKRQKSKSDEYRIGSVPVHSSWSFPDEA